MSDDAARHQGPLPSSEWVAEHQRKLIETAALESSQRQSLETAEIIGRFHDLAARAIADFSELPCRGSLEMIGHCSDAFADTCRQRESSSCPRQIRAFDAHREREATTERLKRAGCPADALESVMGPMISTQATQAVDAFFSDEAARLLVLAGGVGIGKTVAAVYALKRRPGRFVTCDEFRKLSSFKDDAQERLTRVTSSAMLVLDDLGTEHGGEFFQSMIDPLIVSRYDNKLRTVITCNLDGKTFRDRYGERIADRIAGRGKFVRLGGKSMRGAT